MTVGVLIITHDRLGEVLLHNTKHILGVCPLQTRTLNVPFNADPDELLGTAQELVTALDEGDGVLVLTDLYGATPSNIAHRLLTLPSVKIVTGVNMPMMIRIMNYPGLHIENLAETAIDGGKEGIFMNRRK